jgi:hypothetical protein
MTIIFLPLEWLNTTPQFRRASSMLRRLLHVNHILSVANAWDISNNPCTVPSTRYYKTSPDLSEFLALLGVGDHDERNLRATVSTEES